MGVISVKCRKCRHLLFLHPEITLLNGHSVSPTELSVKYVDCSTIQEDNLWFLQDTNLPSWISDVVNKSFNSLYSYRPIGQRERFAVPIAREGWAHLILCLEINANVQVIYYHLCIL
ncbi:hypothetical protein RUM43_007581 [Polyplax serrata]|uniref:Uncharacterized protein n=1 Tax=Polyplax serrata TaxID=468196 RepID=A0AAN8P261_POLSC